MTMQLVRPDTMRPVRAPTPTLVEAAHRTVLVVDDNVPLGRAIERLLSLRGFQVVVADCGTSAVRALTSQSFDVVISDIEMPGMTGVELLGAIRATTGRAVILMTGAPTVETAIEALTSAPFNTCGSRRPTRCSCKPSSARRACTGWRG